MLLALVALLATGGCASTPFSTPTPAGIYDYFAAPDPEDAWSRKIRGWQDRERKSTVGAGAATDDLDTVESHPDLDPGRIGHLREKYDAFRLERRRALASDVADWIQGQARAHYMPDGPVDHWATLRETLKSNGDDCDGLELLTFNFLLELGFPENEVFRAIVVRRTDGQHHMVTLWFENEDDPWVIDPTGAMTTGMPRMSDVPEWVPLKLFTEERDFTVQDRMLLTAHR
jgi:hypothetical protein